MSVSFSCHCDERRKPVEKRKWGVSRRNCRCSAFDGYQVMASDYSTVHCLVCRAAGRTKAAFVDQLPDVDLKRGDWQFMTPQPDREPERRCSRCDCKIDSDGLCGCEGVKL
jgi:hypothetical protein